jgi:death on curing protein
MPISDDHLTYLTPEDIYTIAHEALGSEPAVRDRRLLRSAVTRPYTRAFGAEAYPSLLEKAAALLHSLAAHHLFWDGNKRIATLATTRFLTFNGIQPTWNDETMYHFVLDIAQHKHEVPAIAKWLAEHTTSTEDTDT